MNVKNHVMVDIETLGTRPGDVILSIGAVKFSVADGITDKFYTTISVTSSKDAGLRAQKSTLEWWEKQSPEARTAAFKGEYPLDAALAMFTEWLPPADTAVIWGNGANFDNTLLAAAYRAVKAEVPWKFWNDRCYRTVSSMFMRTRVERVGTYHNALDDAATQALRLIDMAKTTPFELK
jgi:hypothetical protein